MISFGLRVYRLGDKSVWWDEGLAAWTARSSLAATANWTAHDVHPPLYFWLLHFWRLASGDSEFGLRLLSVLLGLLTVAAAYLLGKIVG
ncbi:MAG: glycosyltransferase family 39 protein, partial [Anaerolineae bacterium]